jgi:hypothetical protein|tara:strand:- start:23705 stop:24391 length:687 start_codon:yes stop_codon:yes gene_type:complete
MILVDTVYQRVLALANKEQRGYITPQEFNLLANQAQMEIFEQYFYDQKSQDVNLKNSTEFSNVDEMIDEKLSVFKETVIITVTGTTGTLPNDMYRLGSLFYTNSLIEVEQVTEEELMYLHQSPLVRPTIGTPAFVRSKETSVTIAPPPLDFISCNYIKIPAKVNWSYIVVNDKALYNNGPSINFELHKSDETELVYKILSLAGIVIAKPGLGTYADGQINAQKTQEKQ